MVSPELIIMPFLATSTWDPRQYWRIDPVRGMLNARVWRMTVAVIGAVCVPRYLRYRRRDRRISWGMVWLSVASSAGAYYLPGGTG
jgi:hypothetical protein